MAILINKTKRAVIFGGTLLIPSTPVEVGDLKNITSLYPEIKEMIDNGDIAEVAEKEAEQAKIDLAEQTMKKLKDIATEKGIDVKGMKKAEIISAIEGA